MNEPNKKYTEDNISSSSPSYESKLDGLRIVVSIWTQDETKFNALRI